METIGNSAFLLSLYFSGDCIPDVKEVRGVTCHTFRLKLSTHGIESLLEV